MKILKTFRLLPWSFRLFAPAALACLDLLPANAQAPLPIYTDHLVNGFQDWSWGSRNLNNTSPAHSGANSISASLSAWEALSFYHDNLNATLYGTLTFWANGGTTGGQRLQVQAQFGTNAGPASQLTALPANTWKQFTISLGTLGVANATNLNRINLQLTASGTAGTFYVDDLQLTVKPAPPTIHLALNATQLVRWA